jgi:hypothetical protein
MPQAGVFQLQSSSAVSAAALKTQYLEKLKADGREFGYIVRALVPAGAPGEDDMMAMMSMGMMQRGAEPSGPEILRAYKVTPDGTETLVRGLQLGNIPHTTFRDIVAASDDRTLYSYRPTLPPQFRMLAALSGGSSGETIVSVVSPNLLFAELEVEKPDRRFQRPPIVASPLR